METPALADPRGEHLEIVAATSRLYLKGRDLRSSLPPSNLYQPQAPYVRDEARRAEGYQYGPRAHFSPLIEAFVRAKVPREEWDFALMWDQCCLYQAPRTAAQQASFDKGLGMLGCWYGNHHTTVWMQTYLPAWFLDKVRAHNASHARAIASSYELSGWCFFEATVSACMKPTNRRLDIGKAHVEGLLGSLPAYGGSASWPSAQRLDRRCEAHRQPPLSPEQMVEALGTKVFSRPFGDGEVVARLYRAYFETAAFAHREDFAEKARSFPLRLDFSHLAWVDEAHQAASVLARFNTLTTLNLEDNMLGVGSGMEALAAALADCPSLTSLSVARK